MLIHEEPSLLQLFADSQVDDDPLKGVRARAWELLKEESLSHPLEATGEGTATLSELPAECRVLTMAEAQRSHAPIFQKRWSEVYQERDPLNLLNLALHTEGKWIYLPPGMRVDKPLEVSLTGCSRLHLYVGAGASLRLKVTSEGALFGIDATLEKGSVLTLEQEGGGISTLHFAIKGEAEAQVLRRSERGYVQEAIFSLLEEGARGSYRALSVQDALVHSHMRVKMHHRARATYSEQHVRTVLERGARSVFLGEICIERRAQLSEALQQSRALLLDKGAVARSQPTLSIHADDVKASHGATVSQLSEREMFYLRSRGISVRRAKKLLVEAFCKELFDGRETHA